MKPIQQPLTGIPTTERIYLKRADLPPDEVLQQFSQAPSQELVASIAENWILEPLTVVRDPAGESGFCSLNQQTYDRGWLYYPVAGHRRTLAVSQLIQAGWKDPVSGKTADQMDIEAVLLPELDVYHGWRLMYKRESLKTPNLTNEVIVVKREAEALGVNLFVQGAAKQIAYALGMPKRQTQIQKLIKAALLDDQFIQAQRKGQISMQTLFEIASMRTETRLDIAAKLAEGKKLTSEDVHQYRVAQKLVALQEQAAQVENYDLGQFQEPAICIPLTVFQQWHDQLAAEESSSTVGQIAYQMEEYLASHN